MSALNDLLATYRSQSKSEREKGTYFEELVRTYLRYEATYADLYSDVWLYADWVKAIGGPEFGFSANDTGIDLVAKTHGTEEHHAIQCKCYAETHRVQKKDIDSFFTASGQKPFSQRIIVTTTNDWSANAENSLHNQTPPVYKIDLHDLENSQIDWAKYQPSKQPTLKPKYDPRPHQQSAITNTLLGFKSSERGKLIMACGTGKTFTSLKIAEEYAGAGKRVLFLVPSLSLLSQTLTEWTQQSKTPLHSFAVCSDAEVGKKRKKDDDIVQTFAHELRYPATTDAKRLAYEVGKRHDARHMSVVFSTYHSIDVISRAQHMHGLEDFDLIICDEAHRTTGATFEDEKESNFVKVHDPDFIRAGKRLYMTATPRIYGDFAKAQAEKDNTTICSMDDEEKYGKQLHVITFSEAVQLKLLTDYKVLVLTISEDHVSARLQKLLADENNSLKVDDAARIIGCWKALSKQGENGEFGDDTEAMKRAVAFCQVIERQSGKARTHKVSSKEIAAMFQQVVDAYQEQEDSDNDLVCEAEHVDGSMNASEKEEKLEWLKAEPPANTCRILSNVRCLSEGVDVPALDAVLFLTPRNSQVDVVQSVGRVMRKAADKELGYVVLPVVIPSGMEPHEALNDNKVYKVVWDVLQALRSHDDTFDAFVNKLEFDGKNPKKMEVIAVTDSVKRKSKASAADGKKKSPSPRGKHSIGEPQDHPKEEQSELKFQVGELERALYAKVVKKCGSRNYWDEWAKDIAKIANTHISRITAIVSDPENKKEVAAFTAFAEELRDDLNDSITDAEVIEMLAQHLITRPVFDSLFKDYSFASNNPVSQAMQQVLDVLQEHRLSKEADTLEQFYESVARKAADTQTAEGKQKIVVELYDKFFRNAFPRMTERLGIVYTPTEVVDFIIHSINDLLQSEFGQTLGSKGVHIIDPFTGTGTFITRLLQSGLIKPEELPHKYKNEIHANEIVLLAYYIAAINIEAVYHGIVGGEYQPFEGICLTDTFQLYEKDDLISNLLTDNSDRRKRQKELDIRVIMGNPPYSAGQENDNDNNQNVAYPDLDARIHDTYAAQSKATLQRKLFDSYIRAIRWGSDRLGESGVMAYVSGSGWIERSFADGLRKTLQQEYSSIYVFHLRGDIRKNMMSKGAAKEGGNIFGSGSMTGIAISFFVKNPAANKHGKIQLHDIGDDLMTEEKLEAINSLHSLAAIETSNLWQSIVPDKHHDWLSQRDESFEAFLKLGDKKKNTDACIFREHSLGISTNRDAWCYNFSASHLSKNLKKSIAFYELETNRISNGSQGDLHNDLSQISWSSTLRGHAVKKRKTKFSKSALRQVVYRPFTRTWLYFDPIFNDRRGKIPGIFPNASFPNKAIHVSGKGARSGFSALLTEHTPDIQHHDNGQCFPLYLYEKTDEAADGELFSGSEGGADHYTRRDAITDAGLTHFQQAYPDEGSAITKEDLFYYIYGLLHSPEYRERYKDNLSKELPRIPAVKKFSDFMAFSKAGRDLAHWHLNYETVAIHPGAKLDYGKYKEGGHSCPPKSKKATGMSPLLNLTDADYRVTKMKFAKVKDPETNKRVNDKSTVIYNEHITIRDIPLEAYGYVVNGKPALEWVMDRQAVTTDKKSGITNDANLWATETMGNAKYPLELFLRIISVSLETNQIVASLPKLDID